MKNLCTICMRGGSKGVPNKNLRNLLGKPLMAYTIEKAIESELFEHVVVSTDSEIIAETAKSFGAEAWFLRPPELATDERPKLPVIRHAVLESEKHYGQQFDILTDLDVTSPLREVEDIKGAYQQFVGEDSDVLITASLARKNPYFNMVEINDGSVNLVKHTNLSKVLISPKTSIREALGSLGKSGEKCLMVVDLDRKLLGTLSDGDLRRAILKGAAIEQTINNIYNRNPIYLNQHSYKNKQAKKIFLENKFGLIPTIDDEGILLDFLTWEEVFTKDENVTDHPRNLRMNSPSRRQDAPEVYDMNASIYIWKRQALLESSTLFTEKTYLYVMPEERSIDIDTELDWDFVEFIMLKTMKNND
jgi:CMP-N-acetylneuraminic acid synthetase